MWKEEGGVVKAMCLDNGRCVLWRKKWLMKREGEKEDRRIPFVEGDLEIDKSKKLEKEFYSLHFIKSHYGDCIDIQIFSNVITESKQGEGVLGQS